MNKTYANNSRTSGVKWIVAALVLALLALGSTVTAYAQDPEPTREVTDDEVNSIAKQLFCPVCENVPLDVCGTQACSDWRDEIRLMLSQGKTEEEIKTYFVERYGQRVLATPEAKGINLIVWILPPVAVIAGLGILFVVLRRMAPTLAAADEPQEQVAILYDDLDPEYVARLERDLQDFAG